MMMRVISIVVIGLIVIAAVSCQPSPRALYQKGLHYLQAGNNGDALEYFDKCLARDPNIKMAIFGKARALYELSRYEEALPLFEDFLARTEQERVAFDGERYDAGFYRDKCKLELGMEVPQDPSKIPEEKMRY